MESLSFLEIENFRTVSGKTVSLKLSYQTFGPPLGDAPIVLVNHALTGNSNVTGHTGWWKDLIGDGKCIDTEIFSVLAFNVPGNGYDDDLENLIDDYEKFIARDIASIFAIGLDRLNISELYAAIGGSVGGGLVWELAAIRPNLIAKIIPIACDWKSTDWVIGNCMIQDSILNHSANGLGDARMHAMTLYRTPESFRQKFQRSKKRPGLYDVESWLNYHARALNERYQLAAYKLMNQVLKSVDITEGTGNFLQVAQNIQSEIHIVSINSDLLFKASENRRTYTELVKRRKHVTFNEIKSIHGHDAFLIEYEQLTTILTPIFNDQRIDLMNRKLKAS